MPATLDEQRCHFCHGLSAVGDNPACERIILHGDRMADGFTWRMDVVTAEKAGHRMGLDLEAAVDGAVGEAMGTGEEEEEPNPAD